MDSSDWMMAMDNHRDVTGEPGAAREGGGHHDMPMGGCSMNVTLLPKRLRIL